MKKTKKKIILQDKPKHLLFWIIVKIIGLVVLVIYMILILVAIFAIHSNGDPDAEALKAALIFVEVFLIFGLGE